MERTDAQRNRWRFRSETWVALLNLTRQFSSGIRHRHWSKADGHAHRYAVTTVDRHRADFLEPLPNWEMQAASMSCAWAMCAPVRLSVFIKNEPPDLRSAVEMQLGDAGATHQMVICALRQVRNMIVRCQCKREVDRSTWTPAMSLGETAGRANAKAGTTGKSKWRDGKGEGHGQATSRGRQAHAARHEEPFHGTCSFFGSGIYQRTFREQFARCQHGKLFFFLLLPQSVLDRYPPCKRMRNTQCLLEECGKGSG